MRLTALLEVVIGSRQLSSPCSHALSRCSWTFPCMTSADGIEQTSSLCSNERRCRLNKQAANARQTLTRELDERLTTLADANREMVMFLRLDRDSIGAGTLTSHPHEQAHTNTTFLFSHPLTQEYRRFAMCTLYFAKCEITILLLRASSTPETRPREKKQATAAPKVGVKPRMSGRGS